ncbi:MAG: hypothetical protein FJ125_09900 [Deltaproteobacteria bacterium]|nr:hypothetical protein [Deltaproteobacteria bacterium]
MPRRALVFAILLCLGLPAAEAWADHAKVLPANVWRVRTMAVNGWADQKYALDGSGDTTPLFSNELINYQDSEILPKRYYYGQLENDARMVQWRTDFLVDYGITDSFTFQLWIPYYWQKKVELGKWSHDLSYKPAAPEFDAQLGQVAIAQANMLYPADPSYAGVGDIMAGFKHQLFKNELLRLAYALGVRFPTGHVDDPDVLDDISLGDGQWDAGIWLFADYQPWPWFFVNAHFKYEYQFAGTYAKPSRDSLCSMLGEHPPNRGGEYTRKPGDYLHYELEPQLQLFEGLLSPSVLLAFQQTLPDDYDGWTQPGGDPHRERNTYSRMAWVAPKLYLYHLASGGQKAALPFELSLEYRIPVWGENAVAAQVLLLEAKVYARFW